MGILIIWIIATTLILMFFKGSNNKDYINEEIMKEITVTRVED